MCPVSPKKYDPSGAVSLSMVSVPSHSWQNEHLDPSETGLARILDAVVVRVVEDGPAHAARCARSLCRRRSGEHRRERHKRRRERRRPDVLQRSVHQLLRLFLYLTAITS